MNDFTYKQENYKYILDFLIEEQKTTASYFKQRLYIIKDEEFDKEKAKLAPYLIIAGNFDKPLDIEMSSVNNIAILGPNIHFKTNHVNGNVVIANGIKNIKGYQKTHIPYIDIGTVRENVTVKYGYKLNGKNNKDVYFATLAKLKMGTIKKSLTLSHAHIYDSTIQNIAGVNSEQKNMHAQFSYIKNSHIVQAKSIVFDQKCKVERSILGNKNHKLNIELKGSSGLINVQLSNIGIFKAKGTALQNVHIDNIDDLNIRDSFLYNICFGRVLRVSTFDKRSCELQDISLYRHHYNKLNTQAQWHLVQYK